MKNEAPNVNTLSPHGVGKEGAIAPFKFSQDVIWCLL